jgi:hypothetical protein
MDLTFNPIASRTLGLSTSLLTTPSHCICPLRKWRHLGCPDCTLQNVCNIRRRLYNGMPVRAWHAYLCKKCATHTAAVNTNGQSEHKTKRMKRKHVASSKANELCGSHVHANNMHMHGEHCVYRLSLYVFPPWQLECKLKDNN